MFEMNDCCGYRGIIIVVDTAVYSSAQRTALKKVELQKKRNVLANREKPQIESICVYMVLIGCKYLLSRGSLRREGTGKHCECISSRMWE